MILIVIVLIYGIIIITFGVRSQLVLEERIKMTNIIFSQPGDYELNLRLKQSIGYEKMLYSFWVWPIHTMWPEPLRQLRKSYYGDINQLI